MFSSVSRVQNLPLAIDLAGSDPKRELEAYRRASKQPRHPQQLAYATAAVELLAKLQGVREESVFDVHLAAAKIPNIANVEARVRLVLGMAENNEARFRRIPFWMIERRLQPT